MTRELREVYRVNDRGVYSGVYTDRGYAEMRKGKFGVVEALPLLTDADRAVLEAAEEEECAFDLYKKAIERKEYQNDAAFELWQAAHIRYREAVRARRAERDHVADAGKKGDA
jgi:hypothetical protein